MSKLVKALGKYTVIFEKCGLDAKNMSNLHHNLCLQGEIISEKSWLVKLLILETFSGFQRFL